MKGNLQDLTTRRGHFPGLMTQTGRMQRSFQAQEGIPSYTLRMQSGSGQMETKKKFIVESN